MKTNNKQYKKWLFDVSNILTKNNVNHFLYGGTLLGAIRDKDFIIYDNDIDLATLDNFYINEKKFLNIKKDLQVINYGIGSIYKKQVISISTNINNKKIRGDVYIFNQINNKYTFEVTNGKVIIPKKYLKDFEKIDFLGKCFSIPKNPEIFLEYVYGKDWKVPIKTKTNFVLKVKRK